MTQILATNVDSSPVHLPHLEPESDPASDVNNTITSNLLDPSHASVLSNIFNLETSCGVPAALLQARCQHGPITPFHL